MNFKTLLVLVLFLASILLLSAEVSPKYDDEKFDKTDDIVDTSEVREMKYGPLGGRHGGHGGPRRGGRGSWRSGGPQYHCHGGCCQWYHGRCMRCCYHPDHERVDADTEAKPYN